MRFLNGLQQIVGLMTRRRKWEAVNENFRDCVTGVTGDRRNIFVDFHGGKAMIRFKDTAEEEAAADAVLPPGMSCPAVELTVGPDEWMTDQACIVDPDDERCLIPFNTYVTRQLVWTYDPEADPCHTFTENIIAVRVLFRDECKYQACVHPSSSSSSMTSDRWVRCDADSSSSGGALELFVPIQVYNNAILAGLLDPVIQLVDDADNCCYRLIEQDVEQAPEDFGPFTLIDGGCEATDCGDCSSAPCTCPDEYLTANDTKFQIQNVAALFANLQAEAPACTDCDDTIGALALWDGSFETVGNCWWVPGGQSGAQQFYVNTANGGIARIQQGTNSVTYLQLITAGDPDCEWEIKVGVRCKIGQAGGTATFYYTKSVGQSPAGTYSLDAAQTDASFINCGNLPATISVVEV